MVQIIAHSPLTLSRPRRVNCRKPRVALICPTTGSTICLRRRSRLRQPLATRRRARWARLFSVQKPPRPRPRAGCGASSPAPCRARSGPGAFPAPTHEPTAAAASAGRHPRDERSCSSAPTRDIAPCLENDHFRLLRQTPNRSWRSPARPSLSLIHSRTPPVADVGQGKYLTTL